MKKKTIIAIVSVLLVCALGLVASFLFHWPLTSDSADGNIAKAYRFSRKTATERIDNLEELLRASEDYKNSIVLAYTVMHTRAMQFGALVDMSNQVAGDIPEFEAVLKEMNELAPAVTNVAESLAVAGADLNTVLAGESCPEVTQSTINASVAYTALQRQNSLANRFIETTDKYLKKADASDELLFVRDQWVDYQQMTAALEGNARAARKLKKKGTLLPSEKVVSTLNSFDEIYQFAILSSADLSNTLDVNNSLVNAVSSEAIQESMQQTIRVINSGILVQTISGGPKIPSNSVNVEDVLSGGPQIPSNSVNVEDVLSGGPQIPSNSVNVEDVLSGGPKIPSNSVKVEDVLSGRPLINPFFQVEKVLELRGPVTHDFASIKERTNVCPQINQVIYQTADGNVQTL